MKSQSLRRFTFVLGFVAAAGVGCSSKGIVKGTTPVTAIAPSHTFPYPVAGDSGTTPPKGKDVLKGIVVPSGPRK